jgi:hypothetical protein
MNCFMNKGACLSSDMDHYVTIRKLQHSVLSILPVLICYRANTKFWANSVSARWLWVHMYDVKILYVHGLSKKYTDV